MIRARAQTESEARAAKRIEVRSERGGDGRVEMALPRDEGDSVRSRAIIYYAHSYTINVLTWHSE